MSLSIVFGTPMTDRASPRRSASSASLAAPRSVPSPPITNSSETPSRTSVSTMSTGSCRPRDVPRTVPPRLWMSATASLVSDIVAASGPARPRNPSRKPSTSVTP